MVKLPTIHQLPDHDILCLATYGIIRVNFFNSHTESLSTNPKTKCIKCIIELDPPVSRRLRIKLLEVPSSLKLESLSQWLIYSWLENWLNAY